MNFRSQLFLTFSLGSILMIWAQTASAEAARDQDSLNALYDNLLQREYIGPIAFPNHQVERKAQRSPSLRLRFGRRSDPEVLPQMPEKRWFGDVNQKPIRSPSLRLRFGRRSDPTIPLRSSFDILMNDRQASDTNADDYNDIYGNYFDRIVRKPQRLRFGRSLPFQAGQQATENSMDIENMDDTLNGNLNDAVLSNTEEDFYNTLMHSQKLRNLLLILRQFSEANQDELNAEADDDTVSLENDMNEFKRDIRKPGPLRLRWGRSTGGRSTQAMATEEKSKVEMDQKKNLSPISNNVEKTDALQNKD